ncbi:hypothetical protein DM860_015169 [Cuscuta australis]|uniref:Uncharacterized protein n=1 Tax=Cuscuta australis TaxID=267555 RepID=A0A328DGB3_9ASTE|nr:hypothetical protein DM860_015169 [Cuscuta australis]
MSLSLILVSWMIESLEQLLWGERNWSLCKFDTSDCLKIKWPKNTNWDFNKLESVFKGVRSTICIPTGRRHLNLTVFIKAVQMAIASITHDLENRTLQCKEEQPNGQIVEDIIVSGHTSISSKEETSSTQQQLDLLDGQDGFEVVAGTTRLVEPFLLNSDEQLIIDGQLKIAPEVQDPYLDEPILTEINLLMINEIEDESARVDLPKEYEILLPLFEQHISDDFEQALWVIKEAIRSPFVKEKTQKSLIKTLEGKELKATRDAMKIAQSIRAIKLRGTRHLVQLCCANIDEPIIRTMCGHLIDHE